MAGMNVNAPVLQQRHRKVFVRARCRNPEYRVPATFHLEAAANFLQCELTIEFCKIPANARKHYESAIETEGAGILEVEHHLAHGEVAR